MAHHQMHAEAAAGNLVPSARENNGDSNSSNATTTTSPDKQWQHILHQVVLYILSFNEEILDNSVHDIDIDENNNPWFDPSNLMGKFSSDLTRTPVLLYRTLRAEYGQPLNETFPTLLKRYPLFRLAMSQVERLHVLMQGDYVDVATLRPMIFARTVMPQLQELHCYGCNWSTLRPLFEQDDGHLLSLIKTMHINDELDAESSESLVHLLQIGQVQLRMLALSLSNEGQSLFDVVALDPSVLRYQQSLELLTGPDVSFNSIIGPAILNSSGVLRYIRRLKIVRPMSRVPFDLTGLEKLEHLEALSLLTGRIDVYDPLTLLVRSGRLQELRFERNSRVPLERILQWIDPTSSRLKILSCRVDGSGTREEQIAQMSRLVDITVSIQCTLRVLDMWISADVPSSMAEQWMEQVATQNHMNRCNLHIYGRKDVVEESRERPNHSYSLRKRTRSQMN